MYTVEEFRRATESDLVNAANDCLASAKGAGFNDKPAYFLQAQLYMAEIDRRHNAATGNRDYNMERWVIILIAAEIILSSVGILLGVQQARATQAEHDIAYRVTVNIIPQPVAKILAVWNTSQHTVNILGRKVGDLAPDFGIAAQWVILVNQPANMNVPELFDILDNGLKTAKESNVKMTLYLTSDDGTPWIAEYRFTGTRDNGGVLNIGVQLLSCEKRPLPKAIVVGTKHS